MAQHSRSVIGYLAVAAILAAVSGCGPSVPLASSNRPDRPGAPTPASFARFSDIPVPSGAKMDIERSLVLGDRDDWIGRLAMTVSGASGKVYDFYFAEMPKFGWTPITTVRAETSILAYRRAERIATIQIRDRTLGGTAVSVTVSPRGRQERAVPAGLGSGGAVRNAPLP